MLEWQNRSEDQLKSKEQLGLVGEVIQSRVKF